MTFPALANDASVVQLLTGAELQALLTDIATNAAAPGSQAVTGDFFPATQPISATTLPLPTGAATAAKQDTTIASVNATASADDIFAISPSDSTILATIPKAIIALTAGNVAVRGTGATPVTVPVVAGQVLPIRARYIYATNTTASVAGLV